MITIFMPVYNGIEFMDESVKSVMSQTYTKWELIIGINGYSKNSEVYQRAKKFENDRIRVIEYETKGKSQTLNRMLKDAKYDYIALLDVDDIWYPKKLEMQFPYLDKFDVIGTNCIYFGDLQGFPKLELRTINNNIFKQYNTIINSSVIIRKDLCYWDSEYESVEDYDLWIRLAKQNKRFYNVFQPLVKHRIHKTSAFNTNKKQAYLLKQLKKKHYP